MNIESDKIHQFEAVLKLSLQAWELVFASIREIMRSEIYHEFYPNGWQESQQNDIEEACSSPDSKVWVAIENDSLVGFIAINIRSEIEMSEIYMIAVDPHYQRNGIGLLEFALDWMKNSELSIAMVEASGDPGYALARKIYESVGFGFFPVARYFKKL